MSARSPLMLPPDSPGRELYRLDLYATAAFVVAAVAATLAPGPLRIPFAVFSCVLFVIGCVAFLWAYGKALERSRYEEVSVVSIYAMTGSTSGAISRRFHSLTAIQTIVAIVTAAIRPFTAQAFGILAAMLGLGLAGLWAARHGEFAERTHARHLDQERARRSSSSG